MENIFKATSCLEDKKLVFTTYLSYGEAEFWWMGAQQMMNAKVHVVVWENFEARFLEKYFPNSAKLAREVEFLKLEQGQMFVSTYVARFEYLTRLYMQDTFEAWRCKKKKLKANSSKS